MYIKQRNGMLTFLLVVVHMFYVRRVRMHSKVVEAREERTKIFVHYHPLDIPI